MVTADPHQIVKILNTKSARGLSLSAYVGYAVFLVTDAVDSGDSVLHHHPRIQHSQRLPFLDLWGELLYHGPEHGHHVDDSVLHPS